MIKKMNLHDFLEKNKKNIKNKNFLNVLLFLLCMFLSFFIIYSFFYPKFGTFVGSDMDSNGNTYILGADSKDSKYKITKIDARGVIEFEKNLESYQDSNPYYYRNIEVDTEGNIYVIRELRNNSEIVSSKTEYPILEETVNMYDTHGNMIKTLAKLDLSQIPGKHISGCIRKIQIVNQKLNIVAAVKNIFSVSSVSTVKQESLVKEFSFEITPSLLFNENPEDWVNDIAVLSNGKVFYSTKSGDLMFVDSLGTNVNCRTLLPEKESSIVGISIDSSDNIFFTDLLTGTFYKLNPNTMNLSAVYNLWDSAKNFDIKIRDLRRIRSIDRDNFYAASKRFSDPFHVRLGNNELLVDHIKYPLFSIQLFISILVGIIIFLFIFFMIRLARKGISRIPLAIRITVLFLPTLIITMAFLIFIITSYASNTYKEVLTNYQITGSLVAADKISGDKLESIVNKFGFHSSEYTQLSFEVNAAYEDLKTKIGDKSDYIVLYAFKDNKIYSFTNVKYSPSSNSYNELRFSDPDMISSESALSDCLLEADEITNLQNVRDELLNGKKVSHAIFDDVHGKLDGYFAPINNSNGEVVGFVGNFLDENIHIKSEFYKTFTKAILILGIASILLFLVLCFAVWHSLRPLEKLRSGIESMITGNWKSKVKINSKDEIQDISIVFNDMSERIDKYTDNLILLNEQYLRFVPKELLNLLGKERITDVNLSDNKETSLSILYITFNIDSGEFGSGGDFHNVLFNILGKSFVNIFEIAEKNNGVVQNFSGLGATILFSEKSVDAFNAGNEIVEMLIDERIRQTMRIVIGFGNCLMGVIGSKARCGVSIMSDEMLRLINVDAHINHLDVRYSATQAYMDCLGKETNINSRYLGRCTAVKGNGYHDLYELIDSYDSAKKNMYKKTKKMFEDAVKRYYDHDFRNARKMFSDVIKIDENDKVAIYYLDKCDVMTNSLKNKTSNSFEEFNKNLF